MTLRQLGEAYLAQYEGAPSSKEFVRYNLSKALPRFGGEAIGELRPEEIALWRASLPEGRRHPALRALRQVLEAAVRWKWIEDNPAALVKNPLGPRSQIDPFESWEEIDALAAELGASGPSSSSWSEAGLGRRRRSAPSGATWTWSGESSASGARSPRAG